MYKYPIILCENTYKKGKGSKEGKIERMKNETKDRNKKKKNI